MCNLDGSLICLVVGKAFLQVLQIVLSQPLMKTIGSLGLGGKEYVPGGMEGVEGVRLAVQAD